MLGREVGNHLYGGMDEPELKIIDVFICKLRKKLANASSSKNYIETVWGRGYVLREPSDDTAHAANGHRHAPAASSSEKSWPDVAKLAAVKTRH